MIATTVEQSKHLIELGVDVSTADMCYVMIDTEEETYSLDIGKYIGILPSLPSWSLSSLLKLIPMPTLSTINYRFCCETSEFSSKYYDEPVDAAFEMVVWLKENKKI